MKKPKWVRGKALQTLLALNALQAEDEVLVNTADRIAFPRARATSVLCLGGGLFISCPCNKGCGVALLLEQVKITGWRRVVDK